MFKSHDELVQPPLYKDPGVLVRGLLPEERAFNLLFKASLTNLLMSEVNRQMQGHGM